MCYNGAMEKKKILLRLFVSTLYLSAFTFGGGYVIVTLMKILLKKARMNPIWVMLLAGAANVALSLAGL